MTTPMYPVNSSQISYIGFDDENNILYVTFKNNKTYEYSDVPYVTWKALKNAPSQVVILVLILKININQKKLNK